MGFLETFSSAFSNVYSYKMRSLLTMLGIIIGIGSVIMIMSIGAGVQAAIFSEMDAFNTTSIQVGPRNMAPRVLTLDDADVIRQMPNVYAVTAMSELMNQSIQLRNPSETRRGSAFGLDEWYHTLETVTMLYGRFISRQDVANNAFVTVISPEVSMDVFGRVDSVGERMQVEGPNGRYSLTVIGILDIEPSAIGAQTPLNMALFIVPVTTLGVIDNNPDATDFFTVSIDDPDLSAATATQITNILNRRHDRDDAFLAMSTATIMDGIDAIFAAVTGFIAFVAGISLFVGGVGVMNIMMVTVTERTREIGVRKSLGATSGLIKLQFMMESTILTFIGGIIGIVFGALGARQIGSLLSAVAPLDIVPSVEMSSVLVAVTVSMLVGIVFGVYPAGKAAKLDPVDALRYE